MKLTKACKHLRLSENEAKEMIVSHHELESLLSKKEIKTVKGIELTLEQLRWIKKIAKELKISQDAVISGILTTQLEYLKKNKA